MGSAVPPHPGTDGDAMGRKTGPDRSGATEEGDHGQVRARHDGRCATARGHGWLWRGETPLPPLNPWGWVPTCRLGGQLGVLGPILGCSLRCQFLFVLPPSPATPAPCCRGGRILVPGGLWPLWGGAELTASTGTVLPACPCPAADCRADLPAGRSGEEVQGRGGLSRGQLRHRLCCHGGESVLGQDSPADLGKACQWGAQTAQDVQAALLPPPCSASSLSCLSFPMREAALLLLTGLSSHVGR